MIQARLDRICIVMMSAVGDAVHVLPVINALKRHAPACRITWILQPGPASLVRGHPSIDEIIIFDRSAGMKAFTDIRRELARREFDLVINLQVYFKAGIVTSFTRAPVKLGFDRARARDFNWLFTTHRIAARATGQHVQDQYFEFLEALGVPHEPPVWDLGPWPDELAWRNEFFGKLERPAAAIVVATSKPEKDWLPERWAEVLDLLWADYGLQPVLVGGRSAREVAAEQVIMERARHTPLSALGSGLRNLVGILSGSALVLSPDTGPLHMAVALERPVISLMGYTNRRERAPTGGITTCSSTHTAIRGSRTRSQWRTGRAGFSGSRLSRSGRRSRSGSRDTGPARLRIIRHLPRNPEKAFNTGVTVVTEATIDSEA